MLPKKKSIKMIVERSRFILQYAFILTVSFILLLINTPASSIDLVTEEDFAADKSSYKDFPLRLLFQKLAESDESEKREIRNFIILKQVFDPNTQEKDTANVLEYEESFGIIKEINETNLRLWDPETDSYKEYFIGIDRIPTEKSTEYKIDEANIGKCASVIYSLDDRVYKIKIDFLLTAPSDLYVERRGDQNIVGWSYVSIDRKPDAYKLFLNGEPFETVEGTSVNVPRQKGKVDSYFVKAVYKRGDILIESEPSDVIRDEITAAELQQELLANQTYDRIIAVLNPEEYETAKKLLYDNRKLLDDYLDMDKKENAEGLVAFFQDIDEGDRIREEQPESAESMDLALNLYEQAEQKAKSLPDPIDVLFLAEGKIKEGLDRKIILETKNKELLANETYDRIIEALNPDEYETARKLLYDNRLFLSEQLSETRMDVMERLIAFFGDIDEGDRLTSKSPLTMSDMDEALALYSKAGEKADDLAGTVSVDFISAQRIKEGLDRKSQVEIREKRLLARERYEEVIVSLKPAEWEKGKTLLIDNRQFFMEYLDDYLKQNMERLVEFFQDIDEGDRLSAVEPETEEGLENALTFYKKAEEKAKDLPDTIDISFIAEQKIDACEGRKTLLAEAREKELAALEEARQRKLAAAREPEMAAKEPPKKAVAEVTVEREIPEEEYDRDSVMQLALQDFDRANYASSWNNFLKIFKEQIERIRQGGSNQIRGVLALPVECRAEIFFLIELDDLKNSIDGEGVTENGLEEIRDRVVNREGIWVIISDSSKRNKIRRHISRFDFDAYH